MATRFIAKHGLKSNINKLKLSEGEIAIAYSDDKTRAEIYSGSKDGTPILLIQEINVSELLANANKYTNTKISELVDGAPEAMDTLKELADAISQNSDIMSALQSAIGNKANEAELNGHISDTSNPHNVTKEQLGLENVDNTSDIDKPISTAIQEALDGKAPKRHTSTTNTYGAGNGLIYGHLKLSDSVSSTSHVNNGIAATPSAVKTAYDKAVSAYELANQNQYTHPSTHPASMIVQDSTHRFVSDDETSDWDNKLDANFVSNGYAGIDEVTTTLNDMWSDRVAPPTTITISSSTSKHMLTADYYCSGTNDQTVINNAISALPSTGGKIVLLEGTYNISGQINVNKPNVTICGMGNSTVLNCKQGIWGITATQPNFTVANLKMTFDTYNSTSICIYASGSRCKFENLDLSNAVYGINCGGGHSIIHNVTATDNNINIHLGSAYNIVSDCYSEDAKETGIRVEGICNIVTGCHISDAGTYGILVTSGGGSKVADNIIIRDSYSDSQYSIYVTSSAYNSCTDNVMIGKNYTNVGGTTNSFISNKYS